MILNKTDYMTIIGDLEEADHVGQIHVREE